MTERQYNYGQDTWKAFLMQMLAAVLFGFIMFLLGWFVRDAVRTRAPLRAEVNCICPACEWNVTLPDKGCVQVNNIQAGPSGGEPATGKENE